MSRNPRLYVLDTNVLMHDPTALFKFEEHDVYLPMVVLEELDRGKKGMTETARNVRQVSRFLDELVNEADADIADGIPIQEPEGVQLEEMERGRLWFQTEQFETQAQIATLGQIADNLILNTVAGLRAQRRGVKVVLVTKDINLRIKASVLGIPAEDYHNDRALSDFDLLYAGYREVAETFWDDRQNIDSWNDDEGRTFYKVSGEDQGDWAPNEFLNLPGPNGTELIVRHTQVTEATVQITTDYRQVQHSVWGITARNREQNFALNLLLDPDIDFVSLLGTAGTGKTLLSLAAGLAQSLEDKRYTEIIMTRATVPVGDDIGFLPGTEEEKMTPWMGALTDNLEVLGGMAGDSQGGSWGRAATNELLASRIKIRALNFMRGRTFLNRYVIIDEAQNLTSKQMKTLLTRAGPGTKMICLGNIEQIDTPYLTETTSGLTYAVDRFRTWEHSGHVTLKRGERSRLADYASENL